MVWAHTPHFLMVEIPAAWWNFWWKKEHQFLSSRDDEKMFKVQECAVEQAKPPTLALHFFFKSISLLDCTHFFESLVCVRVGDIVLVLYHLSYKYYHLVSYYHICFVFFVGFVMWAHQERTAMWFLSSSNYELYKGQSIIYSEMLGIICTMQMTDPGGHHQLVARLLVCLLNCCVLCFVWWCCTILLLH